MDLVKLNKQLNNKYPSIEPTSEEDSEKLAQLSFGLMIEKGLTQSELATLVEVDVKDIYRLQGGSVHMGDEFYDKVFKVLGVNELEHHLKGDERI